MHADRHQPRNHDQQPNQDHGEQKVTIIYGFPVCPQPHEQLTGHTCRRSAEKDGISLLDHTVGEGPGLERPSARLGTFHGSLDFNLESAAFVLHRLVHDLENRQVPASRVFGSVYGFWLASFKLT
jgi:hypothetical protein